MTNINRKSRLGTMDDYPITVDEAQNPKSPFFDFDEAKNDALNEVEGRDFFNA